MTKTAEGELIEIMRADRLVQIQRAARQATLDMRDMEDARVRGIKAARDRTCRAAAKARVDRADA
jgi:hypothetical protein